MPGYLPAPESLASTLDSNCAAKVAQISTPFGGESVLRTDVQQITSPQAPVNSNALWEDTRAEGRSS